jgi:hypothetical protein
MYTIARGLTLLLYLNELITTPFWNKHEAFRIAWKRCREYPVYVLPATLSGSLLTDHYPALSFSGNISSDIYSATKIEETSVRRMKRLHVLLYKNAGENSVVQYVVAAIDHNPGG